ncbi:MAG: hypothetical protein NC121_09915 [Blautia sp.]|nr:hypothetical protein [Blautia sp.]
MKKDKRIMSALMLIVGISFVGCGKTTSVLNEDMSVESTEAMESNTATVESMEQATETPEVSSDEAKAESKDNEVADTTPESTQKPTPEPTATPEPTQPPHTHDFKVQSTVESTCATEGKVIKVCSCGEKAEETLPLVDSHNWVEVTNIIHHEAITHIETTEQQVQVGTNRHTEYECAYCGARFDSAAGVQEHCKATGDFSHAMSPTIANDYDDPVYETQIQNVVVVDQEAYDSEEVVGYKCSICGQQKE